MIITRKIECYVAESDPNLKKGYVSTLYSWLRDVRKAANMIVAHKFVQCQMSDFANIDDELREKFIGTKKFVFPSDILKKEKGNSEQNSTYRLVSSEFKGKLPSAIYSSLNQIVSNSFKETYDLFLKGEASVRSYRKNIPMPFPAKSITNLHEDETDHRIYFTLFNIPFVFNFGRDRSGNRSIIERCMNGELKLCSSSLLFSDSVDKKDPEKGKKHKMFLCACVDMPSKEVKLKQNKKLYAFLDVLIPIVCTTKDVALQGYDAVDSKDWITIGTKEEFNHRRTQIQEALRRYQINARYSKGGRGRKKKLKSIDHFHQLENNYIDTKLHMYSKKLVDWAVKNQCSEIWLINQSKREDKAKEMNQVGEPFVLRNWSYFSLKGKIAYKAKFYGITIKET